MVPNLFPQRKQRHRIEESGSSEDEQKPEMNVTFGGCSGNVPKLESSMGQRWMREMEREREEGGREVASTSTSSRRA